MVRWLQVTGASQVQRKGTLVCEEAHHPAGDRPLDGCLLPEVRDDFGKTPAVEGTSEHVLGAGVQAPLNDENLDPRARKKQCGRRSGWTRTHYDALELAAHVWPIRARRPYP